MLHDGIPSELQKTHLPLLTMDSIERDLQDISQTEPGISPIDASDLLLKRSQLMSRFQDRAAGMWHVAKEKLMRAIRLAAGDPDGQFLLKAQQFDAKFQQAFANPFRSEDCHRCGKHPLEFAKIIEHAIEEIRNWYSVGIISHQRLPSNDSYN